MEYDIKKINDFLENNETKYSCNDFAKMLINKFGKECVIDEFLTAICCETGCEHLTKEDSKKVENAINLLNGMF